MSSRDHLTNYARIRTPDKDALADLVIKAKGPARSLRQFAEDLGVNVSTLSRIINKKTSRANSDTLIADIADHADPNSNVTFELLMEAHGMALKETISGKSMFLFAESASNVILKELVRRGYSISGMLHEGRYTRKQMASLDSVMGRCYLDLEVHTNALGKEDSVWLFDFHTNTAGARSKQQYIDRTRQWMLMYAGMLAFNEGKVDRLSIVIAEREIYDELLTYLEGYSLRGGMSLMLIDMEQGTVVDEYVLSDDPRANPVFFAVEDDTDDSDIHDFENSVVFGDEITSELHDIVPREDAE